MKYCVIDFEFFNPQNKVMDLVCCSLATIDEDKNVSPIEEYWLLGEDKSTLVERLNSLKDHTFIAHAVTAEARSFISLGLEPRDFMWIDTMIEWRQLTNHLKKYRYGKHLIKGKKKDLIPFYLEPSNPFQSKDKPTHSLSEMVYKLLDIEIDTDHKEEMRDIIISGDKDKILESKEDIQAYCSSDIVYLFPCLQRIVSALNKNLKGELKKGISEAIYLRGSQMARNAVIEQVGYPINNEKMRNFSAQVPSILRECIEDINEQFPEMNVFHLDKKTRKFTKKEKPIRDWIDTLPFADQWEKTKKGRYSLSLDAFGAHFNYKHEYPRGNFGAQMLRYLKLKQALNGMIEPANRKKDSKIFWDFVGDDGRVRPYLNPYGSQSGRFQPSATGFLFLKPAWMRSLCEPPKGKCVIGIDYKSEEYLIAALESKDKKMIQAYRSGDVYMDYAIGAKLAPEGATKKTHGAIRNMAKPVCITPDSLVRVKNRGYVEAKDVTTGDFVWGYKGWVKVKEGFVFTSLQEEEVITFRGSQMTKDHLCLTTEKVWSPIISNEEFINVTEKERRGQANGASWADVWSMVCTILRVITKK